MNLALFSALVNALYFFTVGMFLFELFDRNNMEKRSKVIVLLDFVFITILTLLIKIQLTR